MLKIDHMDIAHQNLRRDLLTIIVMIFIILVLMAVLVVLDSQYNLLNSWSHAFYRFVLRQ